MKRLVLVLGVIAFLGIGFSSCDDEETCKDCKIMVFQNGALTNELPAGEFCGDELKEKENADSTTIGDGTSIYVCE